MFLIADSSFMSRSVDVKASSLPAFVVGVNQDATRLDREEGE